MDEKKFNRVQIYNKDDDRIEIKCYKVRRDDKFYYFEELIEIETCNFIDYENAAEFIIPIVEIKSILIQHLSIDKLQELIES